jgi:hypothetical protein
VADSWVPKSGTPSSFSLESEFVALVTGDAQWSWLLDWTALLGEISYDTSQFCAAGPSNVVPLSAADFLTSWQNPLVLAAKIRAAAHDRVFAAYCELPGTLVDGWGPPSCTHVQGGAPLNTVGVPVGVVPAGATQVRIASWFDGYPGQNYGGNGCWFLEGPAYSGGTSFFSDTVWGMETRAAAHATYNTTAGRTLYLFIGGGGEGDLCLQFNAAGVIEHTPLAQPPIVGPIPPAHGTYLTIPDLGLELDRQEYKLDQLRQTLEYLTLSLNPPDLSTAVVDTGAPIDGATVVDVPAGAIAAVITISAIPQQANILFTDPPKYARLGTVTVGTAAGWLPSIALEHNPQLLAPLPSWAKQVRVHTFTPITSSVSFLTKL